MHPATITISLACLALAGLGARIIIRQAQRIILGIRATDWPHALAKIKHSRMVPLSSTQDRGEKVEVRYLYEVNGATYEGNTIHPCYPGKTSDRHASDTWERVRGVPNVRVSYDSRQPSHSTLSTGFYLSSLFPIFGGLFMIVPGTGVVTWLLFKFAGWQANFEVMVLSY